MIAKHNERNWTEAEAIAQAKAGDAAAFEFLYKTHGKRVYSVCLRMTRNPAEAEDMTQQTFLQVFRKIGTFRGESGFSTWLHRVTVNVVLMHLRPKKPAEILFEDLDRPGSDNESRSERGAGDTSMLRLIDRLNLKRAIRELPAGYKRHFMLYDLLGYGHKEIALFDGRLKIAASQSAQTAASAVAGRTMHGPRSRCRSHIGSTFFVLTRD